MNIMFDGIVLRDYRLSDIEDEIRWTNTDTAWFYADTPWMEMESVDPDALRRDMTEIMSSMPENAVRWRFEIEVGGRHIGMVSSYYLNDHFEPIPWESIDQNKNAEGNNAVRALGIEICEMDAWGRRSCRITAAWGRAVFFWKHGAEIFACLAAQESSVSGKYKGRHAPIR